MAVAAVAETFQVGRLKSVLCLAPFAYGAPSNDPPQNPPICDAKRVKLPQVWCAAWAWARPWERTWGLGQPGHATPHKPTPRVWHKPVGARVGGDGCHAGWRMDAWRQGRAKAARPGVGGLSPGEPTATQRTHPPRRLLASHPQDDTPQAPFESFHTLPTAIPRPTALHRCG